MVQGFAYVLYRALTPALTFGHKALLAGLLGGLTASPCNYLQLSLLLVLQILMIAYLITPLLIYFVHRQLPSGQLDAEASSSPAIPVGGASIVDSFVYLGWKLQITEVSVNCLILLIFLIAIGAARLDVTDGITVALLIIFGLALVAILAYEIYRIVVLGKGMILEFVAWIKSLNNGGRPGPGGIYKADLEGDDLKKCGKLSV